MVYSQREPVWERARGRWYGILTGLGIDAGYLTGKAGPCPICLSGEDRFTFDNKNNDGTFICRKCGAGTGVQLVQRIWDISLPEASRLIDGQIGTSPVVSQSPSATRKSDPEAIDRLWRSAKHVTPADPVGKYLARRIGSVEACSDIRYLNRCWHSQAEHHPAMLALVRDTDGHPCQLHKTFLTRDGRHAQVDPVRKTMRGQFPTGAAVRLAEPDDVLGVAEGIETAISAAKLFDVPVWACLTAARLETWEPPEGVGNVIIFADNDSSFTGLRAAAILAHRIADRVSVEIKQPPHTGDDWNDQLQRELK